MKLKLTKTWGIAIGTRATASDVRSLALGHQAKSTGYKANAIGADATANGNHANAIGSSATATGDHAQAFGAGAQEQAYVLTYSVLMQLQLLITALQSVTKLMHPLQTPLH